MGVPRAADSSIYADVDRQAAVLRFIQKTTQQTEGNMKKIILMISAALLVSASMPAFSDQTPEEKVICNLAAQNCLNKADILQKRIKKLNADLKKGTKTYSAEDLKKIEQKLQETQDTLDKIEGKTPGK
jgi:uncharacterized protein YlxW (UPF0749 family)